jgi:RNA polymerase sigma-70 factor (ECF subfamily)
MEFFLPWRVAGAAAPHCFRVGGADTRRPYPSIGTSRVTHDPHQALTALLPRLFAFARTMLGEADAARDLVQEAASRALAARRVPEDAPAYRAWLFRIVRNAALDELRRQRRPMPDVAPSPNLWSFDDARIAKITVEQGLAVLPPAHREIISLIDIAGFSYGEAAEMLELPVGTIMSRIARARSALLAAIDASSVRPLKSSHGY